ncbi:MAG: enoyl-CoA hydratase/isomerase family protein [Proteobacteria bacterium]|nr:enoyl-CoA hydratase/isomerase family protein [Pseudomonadota bacterium]
MNETSPDPRLLVERHGTIAVVSFNRPEAFNAFDLAMWRGLQTIMERLSEDESLRCVVLRGAGTKAFSAGADITAFPEERGTREREEEYAHVLDASMQSIRLCTHPVVAMIMGHCLGGGAGLATMCDFRVGGESIRFGITARNIGLWYPYAEIDPIIRMVGTGVAAEILIEGRIFNGREAYEKGLLSRVVADTAVEHEAMALAQRISEGAPLSARFHKAAIRRLRGPLPVTAEDERAASDFMETEDFKNACQAFIAKRKPVFTGR